MNEFLNYLHESVSPAHAVQASIHMLEANGFEPLMLAERWDLVPGGKYYVPFYNTTLIAFRIGKEVKPGNSFRITAAHTDWPCLRVKPFAELVSGGCCKLNIETYGGLIHSTWMDRPLSIAGEVCTKTDDPMRPKTHLINFDHPVLTIPNLAIHMNREMNRGVELKPNIDLQPICRTITENWEKDGYLVHKIAQLIDCDVDDILSFDLCIYNAEEACVLGLEQDMLSGPRLDNLTSCYACIRSLIDSSRPRGVNIAVIFDNEEVGSSTKQGADSAVLNHILEKLSAAMGYDRTDLVNGLMKGVLLSCDVAHAAHPNHMELVDPTCHSVMNGGVVIKLNYNQRYPTDAAGHAVIEGICRANKIPHQLFMNRAGIVGGSTIGAIASARLSMRTIDVGVPILAMHSARELMGMKDEQALIDLCKALYSQD